MRELEAGFDPTRPMIGESTRAFAAFRLYASLPLWERSIDRAWQLREQKDGFSTAEKKPRRRAPGSWWLWSSRYHWAERAAMSDRTLQELSNAARVEADAVALESFRVRLREDGQRLHNLYERLLTASELLAVKVEVAARTDAPVSLPELSRFLRALVTVGERADAATDAGLCLAGLVDEIATLSEGREDARH